MKQSFFLLVTLAVIFEIAADILFKYWSINARGVLLWSGVALYTVGTVVWAYSLKFEGLSKAITIFTVLNLIVITFVGVLLFKEEISLINKIGILFGVISVILLQL
jgi:multidrug transporter EmrE-like cation transporter